MKTFKLFTKFSVLKPNVSNCEVAGIVSLKEVKMAVYEIKSIDLTPDTMKILCVLFSCNWKLLKQKILILWKVSPIFKMF